MSNHTVNKSSNHNKTSNHTVNKSNNHTSHIHLTHCKLFSVEHCRLVCQFLHNISRSQTTSKSQGNHGTVIPR